MLTYAMGSQFGPKHFYKKAAQSINGGLIVFERNISINWLQINSQIYVRAKFLIPEALIPEV